LHKEGGYVRSFEMEGSGIPGGGEFNPHGSSGIYNSNGHHRTIKEDETCNQECAASPRSLHHSLSLSRRSKKIGSG